MQSLTCVYICNYISGGACGINANEKMPHIHRGWCAQNGAAQLYLHDCENNIHHDSQWVSGVSLRIETGDMAWYALVAVKTIFYNDCTYKGILKRTFSRLWSLSNGIKYMKIDKEFPERVWNVWEKYFLNVYFLKVEISLIMHDSYLKLNICIANIAVEGTVSQMFGKDPGSFS